MRGKWRREAAKRDGSAPCETNHNGATGSAQAFVRKAGSWQGGKNEQHQTKEGMRGESASAVAMRRQWQWRTNNVVTLAVSQALRGWLKANAPEKVYCVRGKWRREAAKRDGSVVCERRRKRTVRRAQACVRKANVW